MRNFPDNRARFLIAAAAVASLAWVQAQEPTVRIVSPENGGVVVGRNVELKMEVVGVELTPQQSGNAGYLLLRLDDNPPVKGYSQSFTFQNVSPGNHTVQVELRHADGTAFRPPVRSQVRFAVQTSER